MPPPNVNYNVPPPNTNYNMPPPNVNYNMPPPLSKTPSTVNPLSFEVASNVIRHKVLPHQKLLTTNAIPQSVDTLYSSTVLNPSSSLDFADFDVKFNSLKVDNTEKKLFSSPTSSFLVSQNENSFNNLQSRQILPQSTSMFASSSTSNTTSSISWPISNVEIQEGFIKIFLI